MEILYKVPKCWLQRSNKKSDFIYPETLEISDHLLKLQDPSEKM